MDETPFRAKIRGIDITLYERIKTYEKETEVLDFIDRIKPGEILFDIGACGGAFSLYAAKKGIEVWAFEPDPANHNLLLQNIDRNADCKGLIHPMKIAIGSHIHTGKMSANENKPGGHNKILNDASRKGMGPYVNAVDVITLDSLIGDIVPDYIKIDVDGSEKNLIIGAMNMLKQPRVKRIIFELRQERSFREILAKLRTYGFVEESRHTIEPGLFNIVFGKR